LLRQLWASEFGLRRRRRVETESDETVARAEVGLNWLMRLMRPVERESDGAHFLLSVMFGFGLGATDVSSDYVVVVVAVGEVVFAIEDAVVDAFAVVGPVAVGVD